MEGNILVEREFMLAFSKSASGLTVQMTSLRSYVEVQVLGCEGIGHLEERVAICSCAMLASGYDA